MLSSSSYEATNATLGSPPPEMISLGIEFLAHEFQGTPSDHDTPHALTVITDGGAGIRVPLQFACHQMQQFCVQDSVQVLIRTPFNAWVTCQVLHLCTVLCSSQYAARQQEVPLVYGSVGYGVGKH